MNMNTIKEAIRLFQKDDVEKLHDAMSECIEYVRVDFHIFNVGAYVTCEYSNDLEYLEMMDGCVEYGIFETYSLFDAFMEYGKQELKEYYDGLEDRE